jgi:hypothetical protein
MTAPAQLVQKFWNYCNMRWLLWRTWRRPLFRGIAPARPPRWGSDGARGIFSPLSSDHFIPFRAIIEGRQERMRRGNETQGPDSKVMKKSASSDFDKMRAGFFFDQGELSGPRSTCPPIPFKCQSRSTSTSKMEASFFSGIISFLEILPAIEVELMALTRSWCFTPRKVKRREGSSSRRTATP